MTQTTEPVVSYDEYKRAFLDIVDMGVSHETKEALDIVRTSKPHFVWEISMAAFYAISGDARSLAECCGEIVVDIGNALDKPDADEAGPVGWLALGWMLAERERFKIEGGYVMQPEVLERVRAYLQAEDETLRWAYEDQLKPCLPVEGAPDSREYNGITLGSLRQLGGRVQIERGVHAVVTAITTVGRAPRMSDVEPERYPALRDELQRLLDEAAPAEAAS